jgi:cytochrome P450
LNANAVGHETTANALTMCLYELAKNEPVQQELYQELKNVPSDFDFDDVNGLPYLNNVLFEAIRVHSPVYGTSRLSTVDCQIPLSDGRVVMIPAGTNIFFPLVR